jgi:hypothetical protein
MSVPYYVCAESPIPDRPEFVLVEAVYAFDWDKWSETDWVQLAHIYQSLPGWTGYRDQLPTWFEASDSNFAGLSASVEPPVLQVGGELRAVRTGVHGTARFSPASSIFPAAKSGVRV